jgi:hypothetical protein
MEPATDDNVDLALAILYRRRRVVDRMIQRLEQRENDLSRERFLVPAHEGFEDVKGCIRFNLVSQN